MTNQRVVWVERVIGIYDSRQEVPLSTILAVNVETDAIGRILDYGNVSVRTFVGSIRFDFVDHPVQPADMIREYWDRTKKIGTEAQKIAMKNALRSKLGLTVHPMPGDELPPIVMEDKEVQKKSVLRIVLSNVFKLRVEEGGTVTYRKHWFVLVQQAARPLFFFFGVIILVGIRIWYLAGTENNAVFERINGGIPRPDRRSGPSPMTWPRAMRQSAQRGSSSGTAERVEGASDENTAQLCRQGADARLAVHAMAKALVPGA